MAERRVLSRDEVVDAALALVADEGFAALSMRKVAQRLGVGTMSLYWHVADREELLAAMTERAVGTQVLEVVPTDWREALTAIAYGARRQFEQHAWLLDAGPRMLTGGRVLEHVEQSLQVAEMIGLPMDAAMSAIGAVDDFVLGHVLSDRLRPELLASEELERRFAAGEFPRYRVARERHVTGEWGQSDEFAAGLTLVLDGIAAAVDRHRGAVRRTPRKKVS